MNKKSLDPAGHISLAVSDIEKSKNFYKDLFSQLKLKQIKDTAWVTKEGFGIWLRQAKQSAKKHQHFAPGMHHLCLKAKSNKMVNEIYKHALKKKTFIFAEPKLFPDFTPNYYAASFADPDGIKIEIAYY